MYICIYIYRLKYIGYGTTEVAWSWSWWWWAACLSSSLYLHLNLNLNLHLHLHLHLNLNLNLILVLILIFIMILIFLVYPTYIRAGATILSQETLWTKILGGISFIFLVKRHFKFICRASSFCTFWHWLKMHRGRTNFELSSSHFSPHFFWKQFCKNYEIIKFA